MRIKTANRLLDRSYFVCFFSLRFAKNKQNTRRQVAIRRYGYLKKIKQSFKLTICTLSIVFTAQAVYL